MQTNEYYLPTIICLIICTHEDFGARSRYLRQGEVTTSHSKLRGVMTYPCLRYPLLAPKSSYHRLHNRNGNIRLYSQDIYETTDRISWYNHLRHTTMKNLTVVGNIDIMIFNSLNPGDIHTDIYQ